MQSGTLQFVSADGEGIHVYVWTPDPEVPVKGVIQVAHGMAETALRYERLALFLTDRGYAVYANDHRGHGKTAGSLERVGILAEDRGFFRMIEDMSTLTQMIREKHPEVPVCLLGHSMGSFAAQGYIIDHGADLDGVVLVGSNGKNGWMLTLAKWIVGREVKKNGRDARIQRLNDLFFGSYNKAFQPNRTDFDWLSRDEAEVDAYIDDPYCGAVFTAGFYEDLVAGFDYIEAPEHMARVPKSLPIFIIAGAEDPVGHQGKGLKKLQAAYRGHGLEDVTLKLYPGARHEILNELNRDEVMADIVAWLEAHLRP